MRFNSNGVGEGSVAFEKEEVFTFRAGKVTALEYMVLQQLLSMRCC